MRTPLFVTTLLMTAVLIAPCPSAYACSVCGKHVQASAGNTQDDRPGHNLAPEGFTALFNGKDIDDWVQRGGKATYHVEGDTIVGTSVLNTENTFLCTPRNYADFVLKLELKVDDGLNSGVQIRSEVSDTPQEVMVKNAKGTSCFNNFLTA